MVPSTSALTIDTLSLSPVVTLPISGDYDAYSWGWVGNASSNAVIMAIILDPAPALLPGYSELYKLENDGDEFGMISSYGGTISTNSATINYTGGPYIAAPPVSYVLVKDGNAEPNWYLIALTGWNGTESVVLNNFFNGEFGGRQGGISHVSLLGVNTAVPEPTTLLLLGLGLIGVAGIGRKLKK
ncbi:MAG: PEP-CTERM sorting domain-containing protein [Syntrophaceae bacterium]